MTQINEYLNIAISLDIDPDANTAVEGRLDALSASFNGKVCVEACKKGLQKTLKLLDVYAIESTLFYEARTAQMLLTDRMDLPELSERHEVACHSLKHEDFLGLVSSMPMEESHIEETIIEAREILEKMFGRNIKGFRAPYTRINHTVVKVLERLGFQYDSSETRMVGIEWTGKPFSLEVFDSNLLEAALPILHDAKGKRISSYLWAIFEGKRIPSDHIDAILQVREVTKGGLFIFSIHPWHLYVDCQGNPFRGEQVKKNLANLEYILSQLKQLHGIQILRQDKYLESWLEEKGLN